VLAKLYHQKDVAWGAGGKRWIRENAINDLIKIRAKALKERARRRVFVNSMSDTFEDHIDLVTARTKALEIMGGWKECLLDFLLLTKRPENVRVMVPPEWLDNWPAHVWIGTTVENQETANQRIPHLLKIPAKVRFLSCEPLITELHLPSAMPKGNIGGMDGIDWVICGGESGLSARPMHPDWARNLRDQCRAAEVPFFFKQWGQWCRGDQMSDAARHEEVWEDTTYKLKNKHAVGRLLDGCEWNEVPKVEVKV
jgi:protein gp37